MKRDVELALIDQVLAQLENNTPHMEDIGGSAPVAEYLDPQRYLQELEQIFQGFPIALAHTSELAQCGDFITRQALGKSLILIRGSDGRVRAFLNACRHRGAQLLNEASGNTRVISCPYHSWSYRQDGGLNGMPGKEGFCDHQTETLGLLSFPCAERYGLIWVQFTARPVDETEQLWSTWFAPVDEELSALDIGSHYLYSTREVVIEANWKAVNDAFMEGYHFRFVHKNSVSPLYCDNQGVFLPLGPHYRYFLAHRKMLAQAEVPREERRLRENCLMVYQLFPVTSIQVLPDHLFIHTLLPLGIDKSIIRNVMLIPQPPKVEKEHRYWQGNRDLVQQALDEDHQAAEGVQRGIASGVNADLLFGRYEQGIVHMHEHFNQALAGKLKIAGDR